MSDLTNMMAFSVEPASSPGEVRVNFGVFAGRSATAAEIDDLAQTLLPELGTVAIVSEERREFSSHSEIALHQVRIEVPVGSDERRVAELADRWARSCIADRHAEIAEV